jgi:predicted membrane-bound spermidine synthase
VQKKNLVVRAADYQLITGHLYKMGTDSIIRRYILDHKRPIILVEAHEGIVGGNYAVPVVLWVYRTTCKKLTVHTPFKLVYGQESVVSLEFLIPSLRVAAITHITERGTVQERLNQLLSMEED